VTLLRSAIGAHVGRNVGDLGVSRRHRLVDFADLARYLLLHLGFFGLKLSGQLVGVSLRLHFCLAGHAARLRIRVRQLLF